MSEDGQRIGWWVLVVFSSVVGIVGALLCAAGVRALLRSLVGPPGADPHGYGLIFSIPFLAFGVVLLVLGIVGGVTVGRRLNRPRMS